MNDTYLSDLAHELLDGHSSEKGIQCGMTRADLAREARRAIILAMWRDLEAWRLELASNPPADDDELPF